MSSRSILIYALHLDAWADRDGTLDARLHLEVLGDRLARASVTPLDFPGSFRLGFSFALSCTIPEVLGRCRVYTFGSALPRPVSSYGTKMETSSSKAEDKKVLPARDVENQDETSSLGKGDVLQLEHTDPILNAKMHLINNAIGKFLTSSIPFISHIFLTRQKDEIGFTPYHWKLFVLNGFGYAVDSLILLIQSIIAAQAALEFNPSYPNGLTIAAYVGMLIGALFWGLTADIMGRKIAFNVSLVICSVFAIVAGASPNWPVLGLFVCLSAFGAGGNLVLDTAVFLEYLPGSKQAMLTLMAAWWGMYTFPFPFGFIVRRCIRLTDLSTQESANS
jgi:hypothetical protein